MSYMNLSTEKADYTLNVVNHIYSPRDSERFRGLDALVVEKSLEDQLMVQDTWEESGLFGSLLGVKGIARQAREDNIPIYVVDVSSSAGLLQEFFDPRVLIANFFTFIPGLLYSLSKGEIGNRVQQYFSFFERFEQNAGIIGRTVVSAEKVESYLVDLIAEEKGIERPKIGLIYGIGHLSLVDFLKSEDLRKKYLERLRKSNFKGLKIDQVNNVVMYSYSAEDQGWIRSAWDIDLFEL